MNGAHARTPDDERLVSRLWGWVRGKRPDEELLEEPDTEVDDSPVSAGRVRMLDESSVYSESSPFDTTLDECATVITSAPRL